jgi:hypothetical protein
VTKRKNKQPESTWACGDCHTEYTYDVQYCQNWALDFVMLAKRHIDAPIYTQLVRDTDILPIEDDYYKGRLPWTHPVIAKRYPKNQDAA